MTRDTILRTGTSTFRFRKKEKLSVRERKEREKDRKMMMMERNERGGERRDEEELTWSRKGWKR